MSVINVEVKSCYKLRNIPQNGSLVSRENDKIMKK